MESFKTLIVITPKDCQRILRLYPRLIESIKYGQICFVSGSEIKEVIDNSQELSGKVGFIEENDLVSFDDVHSCITSRMEQILDGHKLPRGVTGWYYQQFLKMQYAYLCQDTYYMVWDGDTIPCKDVNMFQPDTGKPYLDLKHEYHAEYFETMGKLLPGFRKVIERSFISEHMLIRADIMRELISDIEKNENIPGTKFWEKIINAIPPEKIQDSSFSEFETYGTYVALRYMDVYMLREWHSFRQAGNFYSIDTISDRDFKWLSQDFDAISFEKGHEVRQDNANLFDNPEYQEKLTPRQMLQAAQKEYKGGYKEVWGNDDNLAGVNVDFGMAESGSGKDIPESVVMGGRKGLRAFKNDGKGVLIVIASYNSKHLLEECIKSIWETVSEVKFKIVVVDNASTDGAVDYLRQQKDILLIENKENIGFGPACNQAVEATRGTEFESFDVFLLNNDTRLVKNSLENLIDALYSSDDIGAVGSVSNYAGNNQSIDIEYDRVEQYLDFGKKNNLGPEDYEERVRLSGFAMLIKRTLWDDIGGFDSDFAPGYFEDDALSLEILKREKRLFVVKNSFIYHAGSQSFSKTDYNKLLIDHHELFIQKYGFDILKYAYAEGAILAQIPYSPEDEFTLLEYGAGLGALEKAVRSTYPRAVVLGVELDKSIQEIAAKTEDIFSSVTEAVEKIKSLGKNVDILVIDEKLKESLSEEDKPILITACRQDALLYYKLHKYEDFPFDKIKLVIWDMDETFWMGTISEGEVLVPYINVALLTSLTDHGIINSISSKNDEEPVMDELAADGVAGLFVFNDINWNEKGKQISDKLKAMGLRAQNTLFIDDNPRNLEQAKYFEDKLMTAQPDIIPYLLAYIKNKTPKDLGHLRLEQYKLLERKNMARAESVSDSQFLYDSNISITIEHNCLPEIDRIHELVLRSNQLNYTKQRDSKEYLERLINSDWNESAYISASDRFGNYGIIGFYCYNNRERKMEHFAFSCRVMGMGIEQYVYNKLGCPDIEVKGPVSVELKKDMAVDWIREKEIAMNNSGARSDNRIRVLLKGPCDMSSVENYLSGGKITSEFNFINDKGFVTTGQNHSMHIWESENLSKDELREITDEVPFIVPADFETKLFSEEYDVICYSLLQDISAGLYKKKGEDKYISFSSKNFDLTSQVFADRFINGDIQNHGFPLTKEIIDKFASNWEFVGNTPVELLLRNLDYIYDHVKGKPVIILLLGSEVEYEGENEEFANLVDYYREINPIIQDYCFEHDRMKFVNITDYIKSQADFQDCINHFGRDVYYEIAGAISKYINEKVEELGASKIQEKNGNKKESMNSENISNENDNLSISIKNLEARVKELQAKLEDSEYETLKLRYDVTFLKGLINALPYEINDPSLKLTICRPRIMSGTETLNNLTEKHMSFARFGDAEFALIAGEPRWKYQRADEKLSKRLQETLQTRDEGIMIGLNPDFYKNHLYDESEENFGVVSYLTRKVREQHASLLSEDMVYGDALVFRNAKDDKDFDAIRKIWNGRKCLIIEGSHTGFGVGNDLLSGAESVERIICPAENAFNKYEEILTSVSDIPKNTVILMILGPTASVLALDLYKMGYQAIDMGQIDLVYEAYKRNVASITELVLPDKYCTTDVIGSGRSIQSIEDENYKKQIIRII
nr:DUF6492 family protein [uncultured Butyrivibrio sp.]